MASSSKPTISPNVARIVAAVLGVAAVALLVWTLFGGPAPAGEFVGYPEFANLVEEGRVKTATINAETISVPLADAEGAEAAVNAGAPSDAAPTALLDTGPFYTSNPDSPDLKERLLLKGVDVEVATDAGSLFNSLLDLLFFGVFFGGVGFGLYKLASFDRTTFSLVRNTGVTFDDIAGMASLKRELSRVVSVLKNPGAYADKGIRQVKGIVLEGPPGNGKTLFAKALASEAGVNFIATKGADFQSALMSLGARKIRMLFRKAARHAPCIVFIDEFDSIGERRSYAGTGIDKENNRIITAMLNEMDGFKSRDGILVVAATNSYASLDAALVRPGRFDLKFTVGNPDRATRMELLDLYTANKTLSPDLTHEKLAAAFDGMSCAAIESVLNEAASLALLEDAPQITATHIAEASKRVLGRA